MSIKKQLLMFLLILPFMLLYSENKSQDSAEKLNNLPDFDRMWDFQDPAGSEQRFNELLLIADRDGNVSYKAQLYSQIARAQGMQGKFDEAHENLNKADKLITPINTLAKTRILLERGRLYNSSGKTELSKPLFMKAIEISNKNKLDVMTIDAIHMMGIVDKPENQMKWNFQAMDVAEKSEDQRVKGWLGPLYNNMGWSYYDLGDYENAQIMFEKSLDFRESIADQQGIRIAKWTIGHLYRIIDKIDKALSIQLALEEEINTNELPKDGYVLEELAELYNIKGEEEISKKYYKEAWEILSTDRWLLANESERLDRLKMMAETE